MARILILGLDESLAEQLGRILTNQEHEVETGDGLDGRAPRADVIFSGAEDGRYRKVLADARRQRPEVPVVVVSGATDTVQWLDALDAGAADYCVAPFEQRQIRWILQTALHRAA
jgi:DNA-binding response OmpR family regulator